MGRGKTKQASFQISADRLSAVAGNAAAAAATAGAPPERRVSVEPDLSRMKRRALDETPEERKRRLAAKTINFSATIIARIIILTAAALYAWKTYSFSGQVHRGLALGLFAMTADLARVVMKAMTPGSK